MCRIDTVRYFLFLKKVGVQTRAHAVKTTALNLVDQQEVPADAAFPMSGTLALERVILPLRLRRCIGGDQPPSRP
jgi:hypothetical protein